MIFLGDNVLIEDKLETKHIKPRLLGHWGTCPGLNLVYAHINRLIRKTDVDALYLVGPGHGAPAILASLWLEDSLSPFYPQYTRNKSGLNKLIKGFRYVDTICFTLNNNGLIYRNTIPKVPRVDSLATSTLRHQEVFTRVESLATP